MRYLPNSRHSLWALTVLSVAESSFFPIPPDLLLIPMIIAIRQKAWVFAGVCTVASVCGGVIGYGIGFLFFDQIGKPILELYGYTEGFQNFQSLYAEWGFWIVFAGGLTPLPYKVITIASGVVALDLYIFIIGSLLSRGLRFFLIASLLWYFGPAIKSFIENHLPWAITAVFVLGLLGFLVIFFLF